MCGEEGAKKRFQMKCVQEKCFLPAVDIGFNQGLPREAEVLLLLINPSTASGGPEDQSARTITSFSLTWRESQEHKASERKTLEQVSYRD